MANQLKDGGPAFPAERQEWIPLKRSGTGLDDVVGPGAGEYVKAACPGMSLRDYFAGQALEGLLSSQRVDLPYTPTQHELLAKRTYAIADAMLTARSAPIHHTEEAK